jgi:deoxyribodipyrimidine photo-lyase
MATFLLSIHIFNRDLRLEDNSALIAALEQSEKVLPLFLFDERDQSHHVKGTNSYTFMITSLEELDQELRNKGTKLYCFSGITPEVIGKLVVATGAGAIFINREYSPLGRERERVIGAVCKTLGIKFFSFADALLTEPEQVKKSDNSPYTIFTPFMRKARLLTIPKPVTSRFNNYYSGDLQLSLSEETLSRLLVNSRPNLLLKGGRKEAYKLLAAIDRLERYDETRNLPALKGTSLLSAHHQAGTISIRESYYRITELFSQNHTLINELYWRDFFTHIGFHFPHVFESSFHQRYDAIEWQNDKQKFDRWCKGQTGFPIIDAGMRELTSSGYMHNRVRMIVASFLVKDLHIDWRWGERFFALHLIDYDQAVNNGNWQWSASTGCDAQPWFRIFNPWSQQQKFDPDCEYIKRWVPELKSIPTKEIHQLILNKFKVPDYPSPMAEHKMEVEITKSIFSKI